MNFKEAYKEMLKGQKVRRPGFVNPWYIEQDRIVIKLKSGKVLEVPLNIVTIIDMDSNDWEVAEKSKIWKLEKGRHYYYYDNDGRTYESSYCEDSIDKRRLEFGNCFKTRKEASHMIEKLKVINELKKFALENNEEEIDWKNLKQVKWTIAYHHISKELELIDWHNTQFSSSDIYFTSKGIAQKAVETIGEDRIRRYYFDVEE